MKEKELPEPFVKDVTYMLLEDHKENPTVYFALENDEELGLILFAPEWNNSLRIWDILVKQKYRRDGIGTRLMNIAKQYAVKKGYRRLVLETQSCNFPAISFYLKFGFEFCGFDLACYSNSDLKNHEVRLEFHYLL